MTKELVLLNSGEIIESTVSNFGEKDLPVLIQGQIEELNNLDKSVKKAMDAAAKSKSSAERAEGMSAGLFKKKAAIEELQSAGMDLAKAVQVGAEAQKISFEFQTKLAKITKYLFGLGVSNIACNRELEMRLQGASQEKLSALAREELMMVVKQLKDQEDMLKKIEAISEIIKTHDGSLKVQSQKNQQIDEQLKTQEAQANLLNNEVANLKTQLASKDKEKTILTKITLVTAVIALVVAVIRFFY